MYTNCTVALDPDNGELVWFYQHMQNDQWDLDWCFERQLATFEVDGKPRRVVMNVGKIVMMDALDAATGEFLFSVDTGVQNIISAVDPETGAKTFDPLQIPNPERSLIVCPSAYGARSWPPTAYSPRTKFSYIPIAEGCMSMTETSDRREMLSSGTKLVGATHPDDKDGLYGRIQAIDLEKQELAWAVDQERPPSTGLLTTGGGLLFSGDIDPSLKAFDDATGELLWEGKLNQSPSSTVISYMANGKQYVAVVLGMSNNHIRDITSGYNRHADKYDLEKRERPVNNASIRVFALD
jgi:alcohol dehydrogenase (cytochrome c)